MSDKCEHKNIKFTATPNSVHYGREDCKDCGKFLGWRKHPNNQGRRTKTSKYSIKDILEFRGYKKKLCFFCLRKKEQLGKNETLTIDHIIEENQDGEDKLENLQILCTACHKLKNWMRLYNNWHHYGNKI